MIKEEEEVKLKQVLKAKKLSAIPISSMWMDEPKTKINGISFFTGLIDPSSQSSSSLSRKRDSFSTAHPIVPPIPATPKKQKIDENDVDEVEEMQVDQSPPTENLAVAAENLASITTSRILPSVNRDAFSFIEYLKQNPHTTGFAYLINKNPANPYDLTVVEYSQIDKSQGYYTLSREVKIKIKNIYYI